MKLRFFALPVSVSVLVACGMSGVSDPGSSPGDTSSNDDGGATGTGPSGNGDGGSTTLPDGAPKPTSDGSVGTAGDASKGGEDAGPPCGVGKSQLCAVGATCTADADCTSTACNYAKKCVESPSCVVQMGGDTCGHGEVGDPAATHESCCISLPIPITTHTPKRNLDKYAVTAGRMRAFITAVSSNVVGWVQSNRATLPADVQATIPASNDAYLPASDTGPGTYGVESQLGGYIYYTNRPSDLQGCFIAGTGTHSYWFPDAVEIANGDYVTDTGGTEVASHAYSQDQMDVKALNCVTVPLAAAFCAWDGGRLQYRDEADSAYGPDLYPWGNTPNAGGYQGSATIVGPAATGAETANFTTTPCPTCSTTLINWSHDYEYPAADTSKPYDYSYYLAAPGRFNGDVGPYGQMDVAANIMTLTATVSGTQDTLPAYEWSKNGSWEGHNVGNDEYDFNMMTKYGKTGVRCAH